METQSRRTSLRSIQFNRGNPESPRENVDNDSENDDKENKSPESDKLDEERGEESSDEQAERLEEGD